MIHIEYIILFITALIGGVIGFLLALININHEKKKLDEEFYSAVTSKINLKMTKPKTTIKDIINNFILIFRNLIILLFMVSIFICMIMLFYFTFGILYKIII